MKDWYTRFGPQLQCNNFNFYEIEDPFLLFKFDIEGMLFEVHVFLE